MCHTVIFGEVGYVGGETGGHGCIQTKISSGSRGLPPENVGHQKDCS